MIIQQFFPIYQSKFSQVRKDFLVFKVLFFRLKMSELGRELIGNLPRT